MNKQKIVVLGILTNKDKVLLAKRPSRKKIAPGKYHIAGGHVEFGEGPEDAIVREYKEEFDLDVEILNTFKTFSYMNDGEHTVGIVYIIKSKHKLPEKIYFDPGETEATVWISKNNLHNYLLKDDHNYLILKEFYK